jgi:hypothetical protein
VEVALSARGTFRLPLTPPGRTTGPGVPTPGRNRISTWSPPPSLIESLRQVGDREQGLAVTGAGSNQKGTPEGYRLRGHH